MYCRMVRLTDTSDCPEWRSEPRRLARGSPSSVELAGALKSKSKSLRGSLIAQAQLASIAILLANRVHYFSRRVASRAFNGSSKTGFHILLGGKSKSKALASVVGLLLKGHLSEPNCMVVASARMERMVQIQGSRRSQNQLSFHRRRKSRYCLEKLVTLERCGFATFQLRLRAQCSH